MGKEYAVRNLRLCTKDCLCLYVCPTGAADTEDSVIDVKKCIGCRACFKACPSGAISMVPAEMPAQQPHEEPVTRALNTLIGRKADAEMTAAGLGGRLAEASALSCRLMGEDLSREAGFMLPQSGNTKSFLEELERTDDPALPKATVRRLLDTVPF